MIFGQVTGTSYDYDGSIAAFLYSGGSLHQPRHAAERLRQPVGNGINNHGQVAGGATSYVGGDAFLYDPNTGLKDLGTLKGPISSDSQ